MTEHYNLENIRILLTNRFTDEELRNLCFDKPALRTVYENWPQAGKSELARYIVDYAHKHGAIGTVLNWARENNPHGYEKHKPYIITDIEADINNEHPLHFGSNASYSVVEHSEPTFFDTLYWYIKQWRIVTGIITIMLLVGGVLFIGGERIRILAWPPFITISEPQGILTCTNPPEQDACYFEIKGSVGGITLFDDFQIYTLVYPVNPPGDGWYIQQPSIIGTNGSWAQGPAILGTKEHPARNGDTLQIRAVLTRADATSKGTKLSALGRHYVLKDMKDIEGIIALSAPISLTVQR